MRNFLFVMLPDLLTIGPASVAPPENLLAAFDPSKVSKICGDPVATCLDTSLIHSDGERLYIPT